MSHDTTLGMSSEPGCISIEDLVEDAHEEYNILLSVKCWGPSDKIDHGNTAEGLFSKANINTLVQNQVSTAFHDNIKTADPSSKPKTTNSNVHCNYVKKRVI